MKLLNEARRAAALREFYPDGPPERRRPDKRRPGKRYPLWAPSRGEMTIGVSAVGLAALAIGLSGLAHPAGLRRVPIVPCMKAQSAQAIVLRGAVGQATHCVGLGG
jgi:hypothetical protein